MPTYLSPFPPVLRTHDAQRASNSTISLSSTSSSSSGAGSSTFDRYSKGGSSTSSLTDFTPLASPIGTPVQKESSLSRFSDADWDGITIEQLSSHFASEDCHNTTNDTDIPRDDSYGEESDDSQDLEPEICILEALADKLRSAPFTHATRRALEFMETRKLMAQPEKKTVEVEEVEDYASDFDLGSMSMLSIPDTPDFLPSLPSTPRILPVDHLASASSDSFLIDAISPLLLDEPFAAPSTSVRPLPQLPSQSRLVARSPLTVGSVLFNRRNDYTTSDRTSSRNPHYERSAFGFGVEIDSTPRIQTAHPVVSHSSLLFASSAVNGSTHHNVANIALFEPLGAPSANVDHTTLLDSSGTSSDANVEPYEAPLAQDVLETDAEIERPNGSYDEILFDADSSFTHSFATSASAYSVASADYSIPLIPHGSGDYALDAESVFDNTGPDWVNFGYMTGTSGSTKPLLTRLMETTEDHACSGPSRYHAQVGDSAHFMNDLPSFPSVNSIAGSFSEADVESTGELSHTSGTHGLSDVGEWLLTLAPGSSSFFEPEAEAEDVNLDHVTVSIRYEYEDSSMSGLSTIEEEDEENDDNDYSSFQIRPYVPKPPPAHLLGKEGEVYPSYDRFNPTVTADSNHIVAINAGILEARKHPSRNRNAPDPPTITLSSEPDHLLNNVKGAQGLGLGLPSHLTAEKSNPLIASEACWDLGGLGISYGPSRRVSGLSVSTSRSALSPLSNTSLTAIKSPPHETRSSFQPFTFAAGSMIDNAFLTTAAASQPRRAKPLLSPLTPPPEKALPSLPQPTLMSKSGSSKSNSRSSWTAFTAAMSAYHYRPRPLGPILLSPLRTECLQALSNMLMFLELEVCSAEPNLQRKAQGQNHQLGAADSRLFSNHLLDLTLGQSDLLSYPRTYILV